MFVHAIEPVLDAVIATLGLVYAILLYRSGEQRLYWPTIPIALWSFIPYIVLLLLKHFRPFTPKTAYIVYFFTYWSGFLAAAICSAVITYRMLDDVLKPFPGIRSLGIVVYRWAGVVSLVIALAVSLQPGQSSLAQAQLGATEIFRASGVLIFGLTAFLLVAIQPFGLGVASRTWGVSIGLFIASAANIFHAITSSHSNRLGQSGIWRPIGDCIAELVWIWYFSHPEPMRQFILVSPSSQIHVWNRAAAIIGNLPSYASLSGVPTETFTSTEIKMMTETNEFKTPKGMPHLRMGNMVMSVNFEALNANSSIKIPEPGPDPISLMRLDHYEPGVLYGNGKPEPQADTPSEAAQPVGPPETETRLP